MRPIRFRWPAFLAGAAGGYAGLLPVWPLLLRWQPAPQDWQAHEFMGLVGGILLLVRWVCRRLALAEPVLALGLSSVLLWATWDGWPGWGRLLEGWGGDCPACSVGRLSPVLFLVMLLGSLLGLLSAWLGSASMLKVELGCCRKYRNDILKEC